MELLGFCVAIIVAIFGSTGFWQFYTTKWQKKNEEESISPGDIKLMKDGMKAMLHDRLYQSCRYYLTKGLIDEDGFANLSAIYNSYHGLGGNGTGTELYNRTCKLKIVESIEDEKDV